jgi:hypothetical protein
MALTDQDRESIELIATRIAEKFAAVQAKGMQELIRLHEENCPTGRKLLESKRFLAGIAAAYVMLTAGGSALGTVILKLLTGK